MRNLLLTPELQQELLSVVPTTHLRRALSSMLEGVKRSQANYVHPAAEAALEGITENYVEAYRAILDADYTIQPSTEEVAIEEITISDEVHWEGGAWIVVSTVQYFRVDNSIHVSITLAGEGPGKTVTRPKGTLIRRTIAASAAESETRIIPEIRPVTQLRYGMLIELEPNEMVRVISTRTIGNVVSLRYTSPRLDGSTGSMKEKHYERDDTVRVFPKEMFSRERLRARRHRTNTPEGGNYE